MIKKELYVSSQFRKMDEQNPDRLGIDAKVADRFDETVIAILMIAIAGKGGLSLSGNSGGRNEAKYTRRETALFGVLADET